MLHCLYYQEYIKDPGIEKGTRSKKLQINKIFYLQSQKHHSKGWIYLNGAFSDVTTITVNIHV